MESPGASRLGRDVGLALRLGRSHAIHPASRLIVVGSGKGGTGKTFLAANLAVQWAVWGRRVALVDADLGLANLHVVLGIDPPSDIQGLLGRAPADGDGSLLVEGPAGVKVLAGGSGVERLAALNRGELRRLVERLSISVSGFEVVIVDVSAGISPATLLFLQAAEEIVLVSNPDPSALLDAYAVVKVLARLAHHGRIHLIMNRGRDADSAHLASQRLAGTSERYLGRAVRPLGVIPEDAAVGEALARRQALVLAAPDSAAATAVQGLARLLLPPPPDGTGTVQRFFDRSAEILVPRRRGLPASGTAAPPHGGGTVS